MCFITPFRDSYIALQKVCQLIINSPILNVLYCFISIYMIYSRTDSVHEKPFDNANLNQLVPFLEQYNPFLFRFDTLLAVMPHFFGVDLPKRQTKSSIPLKRKHCHLFIYEGLLTKIS